MCVKRSSYARKTVQVVNFIDVLYTLHSHFNHESTDFTGYRKRVNFMPAYLHVHSDRDIKQSSKRKKTKEKNFFRSMGEIYVYHFFFFVLNLSINFSKLNFKLVNSRFDPGKKNIFRDDKC